MGIIFLIIYLLGAFLAFALFIVGLIKDDGQVTISGLLCALFAGIFSWIAVIVIVVEDYGDKVIFKVDKDG